MIEILIRNRQRSCPVRIPPLVQTTRHLLEVQLKLHTCALGLHLLSLPRMTKLNRQWLQHEGPTDVITFNHHDDDPSLELYGEIFLCPKQAQLQARQFHVPWIVELARHIIHGVLHLQGYDDSSSPDRTRMKQRENLLLHRLCRDIDLHRISGEPSNKT